MKLPESSPSLGVHVLKIHLQLGTWSKYITLVKIHWETMKSHIRRKEIVFVFAHKSIFQSKNGLPFQKKGSILCPPFLLAPGRGRRWNWLRNITFKHMKYYFYETVICYLLDQKQNVIWGDDSALFHSFPSISIELVSQHGIISRKQHGTAGSIFQATNYI